MFCSTGIEKAIAPLLVLQDLYHLPSTTRLEQRV